jgi:1-pyrroline-5-carboxylate dehydrogenase
MVHEIGKTRLEALAEVEESADLLRYYVRRMTEEDGYRRPMAQLAPAEATESVMSPYGVWAVVSPFNFPSALAAGMVGAALLSGNTVVLKPSELAPVSGALLVAALRDAGVPAAALGLVLGDGKLGRALVSHPRVAGVAFTGSYAVGMELVRGAAGEWPRPVVAEMGGKNACLVTARADLAAAAAAVARSAFGFGGQKCSACSRVFVERAVEAEFVEALAAAAGRVRVGSPLDPATSLGPLIDGRAVARYEDAIAATRAAGGEVLAGGAVRREGELEHGHYVEPAVVRLGDPRHRLLRDELFVPLVAVEAVEDLEQGLARANDSRFGLTAGLFSRDPGEVRRFLDGIEAGVLYVNRASGATTGAWPGVNPFGGWKGSGSTGPAALGPHYLLRFLREQSRAVSGVDGDRGGPGAEPA